MTFPSNVLKRWSFQKGPRQGMVFLELSGKVLFFTKNMVFFPWMENGREMTFTKKYMET